MTKIHLAKGFIIASSLVLVVKCVFICLVLKLCAAFERTHLVLKVTVIKPRAQTSTECSSRIHLSDQRQDIN